MFRKTQKSKGLCQGRILEEKVLLLELKGAHKGNSFCADAVDELDVYLDRYKGHYEGLIFRTEGSRFFCAGGDLRKYKPMTKVQGVQANRKIRKFLAGIDQLNLPTVVVVEGDCFGGGLEVLSAFDFVVSSPHSFFGFWQRKIGLSFGWGGGTRLHRRLSMATIKRLSLSTQTINAYTAKSLGLIDEISPHSEQGLQRALDWILKQKKLPNNPLPLIKDFKPKSEVRFFEKIWLNSNHKKVLKRFF